MLKNTKTIEKLESTALETVQHAGMTLMALAAVAGVIDLPGRPETKFVITGQPVFSFASTGNSELFENSLRREKEDTAPHIISYSETQRTPARSGRQ